MFWRTGPAFVSFGKVSVFMVCEVWKEKGPLDRGDEGGVQGKQWYVMFPRIDRLRVSHEVAVDVEILRLS